MTLLQVLLELQKTHGFLPEDELAALSENQRIPRAKIEELCSFYPHLRRTPPTRHRVSACRDLSCRLRGGEQALEALKSRCAGREDVTFEAVSCLGRCDNAPACAVDDVPTSAERALAILGGIDEREATHPAEPAVPRLQRWRVDPYAQQHDRYGELRKALANADGPQQTLRTLSQSGLRGMGGAGFPTGRKWELVAAQAATPRYVICNADESEPGTFKDRIILRDAPHLVIEGMVLAGHAIGSNQGTIYIRHEYGPEIAVLRRALEAARTAGALGTNLFDSGFDFEIEVFVSPGGYVLGEETALLEVLEGRRGEPRNKPPYPGVAGLHGKPTLMNNVETFAHVPRVLQTGRAELKFFSLSGDVVAPGVFEVPIGTPFRNLLERAGGIADGGELLAFLPGGASTGFLSAEHIDVPMTFEALEAVGSALGSGAAIVVRTGRDLLDVAGNLTAFFRNESCGKCVPCRLGCEHAVKWIEDGSEHALARLEDLRETMLDTSICGLGQAALNPITSVLSTFGEIVRKGDDSA